MFCKVCGNEVNEQAVACPNCGCSVVGEMPKKKISQEKDNEIKFFKIALIMALLSAFPLLSFAISEAQFICSFVLSMVYVLTSVLFSILGLVLDKSSASKLYCILAIVLVVCSFTCVFVNFGYIMF